VIGEFLQQFFTFVVGFGVRDRPGAGQLSWALGFVYSGGDHIRRAKSARRCGHAREPGQDKPGGDFQNILHETVTGNRIVKAFNTRCGRFCAFQDAARRFVPRQSGANVRIQSDPAPPVDGLDRRRVAIAMFLFIGRNEILHGPDDDGGFLARSSFCFSRLYRSGAQVGVFLQQLSGRRWGPRLRIFGYFDTEDDVKERPQCDHAEEISAGRFNFQDVGFS